MGAGRKPALSVAIALLKSKQPVRVVGTVPAARPPVFVRVDLADANRSNLVTVKPMLIFECWASNSVAAEELANSIADVLESCEAESVVYKDAAGVDRRAWINSAEIVSDPRPFDDPDPAISQSRWQVVAELGIATNQ